jgi:hypothetical protein
LLYQKPAKNSQNLNKTPYRNPFAITTDTTANTCSPGFWVGNLCVYIENLFLSRISVVPYRLPLGTLDKQDFVLFTIHIEPGGVKRKRRNGQMAILSFTRTVSVNGYTVHTTRGLLSQLRNAVILQEPAYIEVRLKESDTILVCNTEFTNDNLKDFYANGYFDRVQDWVKDAVEHQPEWLTE